MNKQFKLQAEWQNQQASTYPQSTLNIMDWPSKDATIRKEMRVENKQGQMKSNKGDAADKGGCPHMIETAAALTNDGEVRNRDDGSHAMAINSPLFLPEPIDLATAGLQRSERKPKPKQCMTLTARIKGA